MHEQSKEKITVFDYTDYRKYLSDYYRSQKKINPAFSYRYFAKKAAFSSSGFYKEIVDGKRCLSRSVIVRFSEALKHNKKEADYFENMVYFNDAATVKERVLYFKKMMASYESVAYKILGEQYEYFSKWYYAVVRELLSYVPFKDDYKLLARMVNPPLREDQARKSIQILEKLKLIKKDGEGFYVRSAPVVTTGYPSGNGSVNLLNVINFQKAMLAMAAEAYDRHSLKNMDMSTLTLSISESTVAVMKDEIANFRKRLLSMAEKDDNPDRVYQLCYHFFPMTKIG
jgi:uncharacterized protein (TIGR02147 family)